MRLLKIASAVIAVAIVVCGVLLTLGIPASLVTPAIQARLDRAGGYRVTIDKPVSIALWPTVALILRDVSLEAPGDRAMTERADIDAVRIETPLWSLLTGRPVVTELAISKPVLHLPLLRDRVPAANVAPTANTNAPAAAPDATKTVRIERLTIANGSIVFANSRDRVEERIEAINAEAKLDADRQLVVDGSAQAASHPLTFELKATLLETLSARQRIPAELTLDAPSLLRQTLTTTADVRISGSQLMINGVSGTFGGKPFTGWASVDVANKPLVKLDLDFQDFAIGLPPDRTLAKPTTDLPPTSAQAWSDAPLDIDRLNYFDASLRLSAARMAIGDVRLAPVSIEASLMQGVLKATFQNLGVYDGHADGELNIDVSGSKPNYALRADLDGVRALPMLSGLADFNHLDGKLQSKLMLQSAGASPRAIMTGLNGTAFISFQDDSLRGINLAKMIRSLTTGTLSGWQTGPDQSTDLTQLNASFRVEQGKAATSDLMLAGPLVRMTGAGTVDLVARTLALRVEPKLVLTTEGQGGEANPVGLGIPVVIDGPWAQPRIYPDAAGILDNPAAAYAKLRELGQGLFGGDPANPSNGSFGDTLGAMIRQGLGDAAKPPAASGAEKADPAAPKGASPIDGILKQLFGRQ